MNLHPILQVLYDRWLDRLPLYHTLLGDGRHLWIIYQEEDQAVIALSADHRQLRLGFQGTQHVGYDLADPDCIRQLEVRLFSHHLLEPT